MKEKLRSYLSQNGLVENSQFDPNTFPEYFLSWRNVSISAIQNKFSPNSLLELKKFMFMVQLEELLRVNGVNASSALIIDDMNDAVNNDENISYINTMNEKYGANVGLVFLSEHESGKWVEPKNSLNLKTIRVVVCERYINKIRIAKFGNDIFRLSDKKETEKNIRQASNETLVDLLITAELAKQRLEGKQELSFFAQKGKDLANYAPVDRTHADVVQYELIRNLRDIALGAYRQYLAITK